MENIQLVYIGLSVIFAAVLTYMYLYTTHLHPNERTMAAATSTRRISSDFGP